MSATSAIDFRTPAAGFDQPLAMWLACHERVARMVNLLERLVEHVKTNGADEQARTSATSVRRYFDEAAPRHHDDEEVDLFPCALTRLRERGAADEAARLQGVIEALQREHEEMGALWQSLRVRLQQVEAGTAAVFDPSEVARFASGYRAHIEVEEREVAPVLRARLTEQDLTGIGRAMAARRDVDFDELVRR